MEGVTFVLGTWHFEIWLKLHRSILLHISIWGLTELSQSRHIKFKIFPTQWSEFKTSNAYFAGSFHQEHRHHMTSHLKLPSTKASHDWRNGSLSKTVESYLLKIIRLLHEEASEAKMRRMSLSSDTIQWWISDMSEDVKNQMQMKECPTRMFSFPVDLSTDVTSRAQLLYSFMRH